MAKKRLYGNGIDPACEICLHGRRSSDGKAILCEKRGIMPLYESCRRFVYDPLRRTPRRPPPLTRHEEEEFKLE